MDDTSRTEIEGLIKKFVTKRFEDLKILKLKSFNLNPFLLNALALDTPRKVAEFLISQRVERGRVTALGTLFESIMKAYVHVKSSGVDGGDLSIEKDGVTYYIQVKSGPQTLNTNSARDTCNKLREATGRAKGGSTAIILLVYGNEPGNITKTVCKKKGVKLRIGSDAWTFVTGEEDAAHKVFLMFGKYEDLLKKSGFKDLYDDKTDDLTTELRERYGNGGKPFLEAIFQDHMYPNKRLHRADEKRKCDLIQFK